MRKKSKSTLAIFMAVAMMSSLCSVPAAAAETETGGVVSETPVVEAEETQETETEEPEAAEAEDFSAEDEISVEEDDEIAAEDEETDELAVENEDEVEAVGDEEEFTDDAAGDEAVESYPVAVFGIDSNGKEERVDINSTNKDDVLGNLDGDAKTVVYNPAENKLTLNNAKISTIAFFTSATTPGKAMKLELNGQNELSGYLWQYDRDATLEIYGTGSLKITRDRGQCISCDGNLTFNGAKVELISIDNESSYNDPYGIKIAGNLEIKNHSM